MVRRGAGASRRCLLLAVLLGALASACAAPAAPSAATATPAAPAAGAADSPTATPPAAVPIPLKIPYTAISGSSWPVWIAQDAGYFAEQGLDVDLEYVASGAPAMQSMLSGEVGIVPTLAAPIVINAVLEGADAVLIGATNNTVAFALMVAPAIGSYADLSGKRLGVSRLGSASDAAVRFALGKWGLRPDDDVAILQMGGIPAILAGMQSGAIDGGALSPPTDLQARQAGYHELADLGALGLDYPQTTIATTRAFLREHEAVARRYLRATVEAVHLLKTDAARAQAIFGKYTNTSDPAILDGAYRVFVDKTAAVPYVRPAAVQTALAEVAQEHPRAASLRVDDFVDNHYLEELEASGFVQRLYGR